MSEILLDWHDDAAVVTINRPDERNALGSPQLDELTLRLQEASERTSISALIITGTGTFCAGGDLKALRRVADGRSATPSTYNAAHRMIRTLLDVPVPTIAAVDGAAVGLGMDLALACDSRLVGTNGWMRQGWARYGAIPATGGLVFLERLAPGVVWRLLDGQPKVDGALAESLGIGEAVDGQALDAALVRARHYAEIPGPALRQYVRMLREPVIAVLTERLATYAEVQASLFNGGMFGERVAEALERGPSGDGSEPS